MQAVRDFLASVKLEEKYAEQFEANGFDGAPPALVTAAQVRAISALHNRRVSYR